MTPKLGEMIRRYDDLVTKQERRAFLPDKVAEKIHKFHVDLSMGSTSPAYLVISCYEDSRDRNDPNRKEAMVQATTYVQSALIELWPAIKEKALEIANSRGVLRDTELEEKLIALRKEIATALGLQ